MASNFPVEIEQFSAADKQRMDDLLDRNSEGTITPEERVEVEDLVSQAEQLMVRNARRMGMTTGRPPIQ